MKRILRFIVYPLVLIGCIIISTTSCKNDKDDDPQDTGYFFKCKINGVDFAVTTHLSDFDGSSGNIGGQQLNATNQSISMMSLYADNLATAGTGTYTPSSSYGIVFMNEAGSSYFYNGGSFEITEYNAGAFTVRGSFSSITLTNGSESIVATDGSFYVYMIH
jgi:hypothetical protein